MNGSSSHTRRQAQAAFTLVEAMLAIAFTAMAGSVLLLGIGGSVQTTSDALHETVAQGMAQQLMDEVLGGRYAELGSDGYAVTLGPSAEETGGAGRELFDDIADYNLLRTRPPQDPWGIDLGKEDGQGSTRHVDFWAPADRAGADVGRISFFAGWRQEVDVYYVAESDLTLRLPAGQWSDYRAVEVRIVQEVAGGSLRELAKLRRVVAYVPPLP
ncbi:MAG: type II secretion system protein [Thermoguttaceae bacterium]